MAAHEVGAEAQREERRGEGEKRFHGAEGNAPRVLRWARGTASLGSLPMPQKRYLLTPGPTPVPPEVLAALAEPVIHHRSPDFKTVFQDVHARLREVFRTASQVLLFHSFAPGATMEQRKAYVLVYSIVVYVYGVITVAGIGLAALPAARRVQAETVADQ